jgi:YafQ family addiction module toxin component
VHEYRYSIEKRLKAKLKRLHKKNKKLYDVVLKRVEEIINNPAHYKPLRYDLKGMRRIHLEKSFVLVFEIDEEERMVRFLDLGHHDEIYKKRY